MYSQQRNKLTSSFIFESRLVKIINCFIVSEFPMQLNRTKLILKQSKYIHFSHIEIVFVASASAEYKRKTFSFVLVEKKAANKRTTRPML